MGRVGWKQRTLQIAEKVRIVEHWREQAIGHNKMFEKGSRDYAMTQFEKHFKELKEMAEEIIDDCS